MTRRGSVAYYLAAWACGCLFTSACVWIQIRSSMGWYVAGFLGFYAFSLLFGAFTSSLFALALRKLSVRLRFAHLWQWVAIGGVLSLVLVGSLGTLGLALLQIFRKASDPATLEYFMLLLFGGPAVVTDAGLWPAGPAGMATAFVLCHIHRAFEPRPESHGQ